MGTKRRSFLPFLSFPSFLSFQSFLPFLPLETFLSFFSFLPLESFQSFLTFLSFHTGKTFLSFLSFQACLALSVTALKRRATSPARGRGSPLRHSPLARPVPPLPHAGEANVTCRLQPPTFTGEVARRAGEGQKPPSFWTGAQGLHQGCAGAAGRLTAGCGTARRSPPRWCRGGCRDGRRRRKRFRPGRGCPPP